MNRLILILIVVILTLGTAGFHPALANHASPRGTSSLQLSTSIAVPHPGWFGFMFSYHAERKPDGRPKPYGFLVIHKVYPGGSAAKAGLEVNDLVTKIEGLPVHLPDAKSVVDFFSRIKVGEQMHLTIARAGSPMQLTLRAGPMPANRIKGWERLWRSVHPDGNPKQKSR